MQFEKVLDNIYYHLGFDPFLGIIVNGLCI